MADVIELDKAAARSLEGRRLGRYRIRHKLAEGGMANIYLAQIVGQQHFERWVAVKVVHPESAEDPQFAHMLGDEARLIARIHHPNVCSIIDFGQDENLLYLVMEYLHGETLMAAVRRGWAGGGMFPAWLAARAVSDAARGLHAAHELTDRQGELLDLVHRDISPENILVTYDGPASVIDFGVLRARGRKAKTAAGVVKGKLSHMAPEQLLGGHIDRRADVWSLGVVLWEATLGRRLFRAKNQGETIERVVHGPIKPPSTVTANYPKDLEQIVMAALNRDVLKRTPTAKVLAHQLDEYLYGLGRPVGYAEVSTWMRDVFSDRLLVREELLVAPEDSGPISMDGLSDMEASSSNLVAGRIGPTSFAPPPIVEPTGLTQVGTPTAKRTREEEKAALREEVDQTLEELRQKNRRFSTVVLVLVLVTLSASVALLLVLLR